MPRSADEYASVEDMAAEYADRIGDNAINADDLLQEARIAVFADPYRVASSGDPQAMLLIVAKEAMDGVLRHAKRAE